MEPDNKRVGKYFKTDNNIYVHVINSDNIKEHNYINYLSNKTIVSNDFIIHNYNDCTEITKEEYEQFANKAKQSIKIIDAIFDSRVINAIKALPEDSDAELLSNYKYLLREHNMNAMDNIYPVKYYCSVFHNKRDLLIIEKYDYSKVYTNENGDCILPIECYRIDYPIFSNSDTSTSIMYGDSSYDCNFASEPTSAGNIAKEITELQYNTLKDLFLNVYPQILKL